MADLSLLRNDVKASRCIMFAFPTSKYHMEGKVNATLQALYAVLTADINSMSSSGVCTKKGVPQDVIQPYCLVFWSQGQAINLYLAGF